MRNWIFIFPYDVVIHFTLSKILNIYNSGIPGWKHQSVKRIPVQSKDVQIANITSFQVDHNQICFCFFFYKPVQSNLWNLAKEAHQQAKFKSIFLIVLKWTFLSSICWSSSSFPIPESSMRWPMKFYLTCLFIFLP